MKYNRVLALAAVAAVALAAGQASAQATISNGAGTVVVGIGTNGELFNGGPYVGMQRTADGYDPIAPGTPRDSWGISSASGSAWADENFFGSNNINSTTIVAGANSASYDTVTSVGFDVLQNYSFVGGGNILRIDTTVTNISDITLSALFQRDVDWDIDPSAFAEVISGPHGSDAGVVDSTYYGFEDPDPANGYGFSCFGGCTAGPSDLGGGIKINLGSLLSGATRSFTYFYGINFAGDSEATLITQGHAAGANYIISGRSQGGENSAFIGVSTGAVPEPATWAMMILGFFGLGAMVRRRRAVTA